MARSDIRPAIRRIFTSGVGGYFEVQIDQNKWRDLQISSVSNGEDFGNPSEGICVRFAHLLRRGATNNV